MKKGLNPKIRKFLSLAIALTLVMSVGVAAFAEGPLNNGGSVGGMEQFSNNMGNQIPGNNGSQGGANQPPQMNGTNNNINQQMQMNNSNGSNNQQFSMTNSQSEDAEREIMTPPEDSNAQPGENVPAKPENDNQENNNQNTMPMNKPDDNNGINMRAIESYFESVGDEVDSNVKSAYDALSSALASSPIEGEDSSLSDLEIALQEALNNANVDLDEYMEEPELPDESMVPEDVPEKPEEDLENQDVEPQGEPSEFMQFVLKYWDKLVEMLKTN